MENLYGGSIRFAGAGGGVFERAAARLGLAAMLRQFEAGSFSGYDLAGVCLKSTKMELIEQNGENNRNLECKTAKW